MHAHTHTHTHIKLNICHDHKLNSPNEYLKYIYMVMFDKIFYKLHIFAILRPVSLCLCGTQTKWRSGLGLDDRASFYVLLHSTNKTLLSMILRQFLSLSCARFSFRDMGVEVSAIRVGIINMKRIKGKYITKLIKNEKHYILSRIHVKSSTSINTTWQHHNINTKAIQTCTTFFIY